MDFLKRVKDLCLSHQTYFEQELSTIEQESFEFFINQFYEHIDVDTLRQYHDCYGDSFLKCLVKQAWEAIQYRSREEPFVCISDASAITNDSGPSENDLFFVTVVNNDRPFLIDSLLAFFQSIDEQINIISHPVFCVERDDNGKLNKIINLHAKNDSTSESVISFILRKDIKIDSATLKEALIERFLHVQSVVDDFSLCQETLFHVGENYDCLSRQVIFPEFERNQISFSEMGKFLQWLIEDYFIFLGARYFKINSVDSNGKVFFHFDASACQSFPKHGIGLFRYPVFQTEVGLTSIAKSEPDINGYGFGTHMMCNPAIRNDCKPFPFFSISKSPIRSTVHKNVRIDSIEVMDLDENGVFCGMYQFIGVFTRKYITTSPFNIPILCNRVQRAFNHFDIDPACHNGKILKAILSTIPNDELFQYDEKSLLSICEKVLRHKKKCALSIKVDLLGRFTTVLLFLPREKYSQEFKTAAKEYFEKTLNGNFQTESSLIGEQEFARILFVIDCDPTQKNAFDIQKMEDDINILSQTWVERLEQALKKTTYFKDTLDLHHVFPEVYQAVFTPYDGMRDFKKLVDAKLSSNTFFVEIILNENAVSFTFQIFSIGKKTALSELMPIFQNLSINVLGESSFHLSFSSEDIYLHSFECMMPSNFNRDDAQRLTEGFLAIWNDAVENDRLNALIFQAELNVRQVTILRALVRAINQMQFPASIDYVATISLMYPDIAKRLVNYFETRFDPSILDDRNERMELREKELNEAFQLIKRNDHERIIRHIFSVIKACVRTNVYQEKQYISFKFECDRIPSLPKPIPLYEIFVYASYMEGVHIRTGKVARGGIRWSDRLEDFRQEVLTLAKTQLIKNSIIIPVGAKGGFVSRRYESMIKEGAAPSLLKAEVIHCYKTFIRGLLDITDNQIGNECVGNSLVIRYDDDDPYLVVAADKGTASFSDIANEISKEYNFWLDDAFASGGSMGYDHKKMAITSRGAWISVKNHFQTLDFDCQETPFSVVGVGDMAGDIFGNGMLQSDKIQLIAAFNHQHIFLDPNPDPKATFDERKRLFDMPTSTWSDYNKDLISTGGSIFNRNAKQIPLSKEVKVSLSIPDYINELAPENLIQYILQASVDLLWFGGIGTYVRARSETNLDVCDPHNDLLRIDASQLRCRVIGEGANLAMTQKARIEYALLGGLLNTDAIDNSAGVSCSDHEVNIKILFSHLMQEGKIIRDERNHLLSSMTVDIAEHILNDNHEQNHVLTWLERHSRNDLYAYSSLIATLENNKFYEFNRKRECLPDDHEIMQRIHDHIGITRPELSIVLAYSKIILFQHLLSDTTVDMKDYTYILMEYFPNILCAKFSEEIKCHPLSREIIATVVSNKILNQLGPIDVFELIELNNNNIWETIYAYLFVVDLFDSQLKSLSEQGSHYDVVLIIRQLMMIYARHRLLIKKLKKENYDFKINIKVWTDNLCFQLLPEIFDLFCQITLNKVQKNPFELCVIYKQLKETFLFEELIQLAKQVYLKMPWQRQTKAYLLDDWVSVEIKLILFVHENKDNPELMKNITNKNEKIIVNDSGLNPVHVLSRMQKSNMKNDLNFISYYIYYFERFMNLNLKKSNE